MKSKYLKSIYELNKEGYVQINTPCGITQDIEIGQNLKQGTILAAPICANHIDKGKEPIIKKRLGIRYGRMVIPPLLYQDDIMFASISVEIIAEEFQKQNLLNFNLDKSERMIMNFRNKKSKDQGEKLKLNEATLKEMSKYIYPGDIKNNRGTVEECISSRKNSTKAIINEIKFLISQPVIKIKTWK